MIQHPARQDEPDDNDQNQSRPYTSWHREGQKIQPLSDGLDPPTPPVRTPFGQPAANAAADLIRHKLEVIYSEEPAAKQEMTSVIRPEPLRSKHQQFMYDLSTSGKPLAQIQTEWHNYYVSLPDDEKHQVWREFYEANAKNPSAFTRHYQPPARTDSGRRTDSTDDTAPVPHKPPEQHLPELPPANRASVEELHTKVVTRVIASSETQSRAKRHLHSLAFGLGTGLIVLFVLLFGLFNEIIIAPFIQPSRHVSATPIILSADSVAASAVPEVIIPKINVQIPVVYGLSSSDESVIQKALENGVIHYPTTSLPGQQGNAAFFGHSSNNIFNKGKYKFAFVLLSHLVPGDTFYLTYDKRIYTYRVYDKKVVSPSEVSVLSNVTGKPATVTLITCDPPGTSSSRLVVWGEQISPDPSAATAPASPSPSTAPATLTGDGPSLWRRLINWDF